MKMMDIGIVNIDRLKSELRELYYKIIDKPITKETYEYILKRKIEGILNAKCSYSSHVNDYIFISEKAQYVESVEEVICEDEYYAYGIFIHVKKIEDEKLVVIVDLLEINVDIGEKEEDFEDDDYQEEEDFEEEEDSIYCVDYVCDSDIEESSDYDSNYDYQEDDFY